MCVQLTSLVTERAHFKPGNLQPVPESECAKVVRLNSLAEQKALRLNLFDEVLYPRAHPMFAGAPEEGTAPVPRLLGVPLVLIKAEPLLPLRDRADFDNQWYGRARVPCSA